MLVVLELLKRQINDNCKTFLFCSKSIPFLIRFAVEIVIQANKCFPSGLRKESEIQTQQQK